VEGRLGEIVITTPNLPAIILSPRAWNRGRIIGQKRPLQPKHVWAIRVRLELAESARELALFNLAIDSKLRGCDLVRLTVSDIYVSGCIKERTSILQSKTKQSNLYNLRLLKEHAIRSLLGSTILQWLVLNFSGQAGFMNQIIYQRVNT